MPGRSAAKPTSRSGLRAIARRQPVTARLNGSVGLSLATDLPLMFDDMPKIAASRGPPSAQRHVDRRFRQLLAEAALIELGDDRPLQLVTLVDEGEPEGEADVLEDLRVFRPGDHRARAHHGREIAVHEGVAG